MVNPTSYTVWCGDSVSLRWGDGNHSASFAIQWGVSGQAIVHAAFQIGNKTGTLPHTTNS